jgi:hypothetical protein
MGGLAIPLVEVISPSMRPDARHVMVEREDYAGSREVSGLAAVRTERADGSNDVTVFAPVARSETKGRM